VDIDRAVLAVAAGFIVLVASVRHKGDRWRRGADGSERVYGLVAMFAVLLICCDAGGLEWWW